MTSAVISSVDSTVDVDGTLSTSEQVQEKEEEEEEEERGKKNRWQLFRRHCSECTMSHVCMFVSECTMAMA